MPNKIEKMTNTEMEEIDKLFTNGHFAVSGMIMPWYGRREDIPNGWIPCDGTNPLAPDLSNKFISIADNTFTPNGENTGGSNKVKLTINTMPSHDHEGKTSRDTWWNPNYAGDGGDYNRHIPPGLQYVALTERTDHRPNATMPWMEHNHQISPTGGDKPFDIVPEYVAMLFIMKT